ncbi:MAG: bifunctional phosphopantothenoylcysteine decarboxylase/phosphopantothenate--cysteine ligase CoaBC [Balneolaceae bacterium]
MDWSGKRILLGVTGGIAAYKSVILLREFQKKGADVRVTMTPSATRFVGVETFKALSRHDVAVDVFHDGASHDSWTRHIHWGEWADLFLIAPCTANTLSKLVQGQADNMLTSVALAARCPLLLCPTMDAEMINHPAVVRNLSLASEMGYAILEPESGYLASGLTGTGRLPEPELILRTAGQLLKEKRANGPLAGKKVVVTAGPTREFIDPVRFISNPSSGKMGIAMAVAARALGGDVTLLHGPLSTTLPKGIRALPFTSADELYELIQEHADAGLIIMSAAVSDFKPDQTYGQKMKKETASLDLKLSPNPDILAWLGSRKRSGQILIGFAMETENLEENARIKMEKKKLDWICANDLTGEDSGFESDQNQIILIGHDSETHFKGDKQTIAKQILLKIFDS